jgi:hypothetical protein
MAKKLDFSKFKELLMTKGERVGLAAAAGIGGLLLLLGVFSGMAATSKDYSKKAREYAESGKRALVSGKEMPVPEGQDRDTAWRQDPLETGIHNPLQQSAEVGKTNKRLPRVIQPTPIPEPAKSEALRLPQGISVLGVAEVPDPDNPKDKKKIRTFKQVQIDYLLAGVRGYKLSFENETFSGLKDNAGKPQPVDVLLPQRLVVVHAVYDYEKQLKEFADAYGTTVDDILGRKKPEAGKLEPEGRKKDPNNKIDDLSSLLPKVLGMEIVRYEYAPGKLDDPPKKTLLYQFSADEYSPDKEGMKKFNHVKVDKLAEFFKSSVFEDDITEQLTPYHQRGLMTPLPKLLTGSYPELRLQGITKPKPIIVKSGDPKQPPRRDPPKQKGDGGINLGIKKKANDPKAEPEAPDIKAEDFSWKELEDAATGKQSHLDQFKGDFEILDPYGEVLQKDGAKLDPNMRPKGGIRQGPGPGQREPKRTKDEADDKMGPKLIRFIDVLDENALPGTTYMYSIQVYLGNPYYGKNPVDLNPDWTKSPVLRPDERSMTGTPPITIPQENFFYAANQDPTESKVPRGNDLHEPKPSPGKGDMDQSRVAVQIQQWKGNSGDHQIGDWVVVERLLVRRGDPIGRRSDVYKDPRDKKFQDELGIVMTEMPYWDPLLGSFRLPTITRKIPDKKNPKEMIDKVEPSGIPMTFLRINPPDPILVDFEGGKRDKTDKLFKGEESNYEMLLIGADGKLFVRNSAVDSQDKDRIARYQHWKERIIQARKDLQDTLPALDPGPGPKKGGR